MKQVFGTANCNENSCGIDCYGDTFNCYADTYGQVSCSDYDDGSYCNTQENGYVYCS